MPELTGYSHVGLSVTDVDRSAQWYVDVLGFVMVMPTDGEGFQRRLLAHPASGQFLGITRHDASTGTAFSEHVAGLDHLAFGVADRDELVAWERHLAGKGVRYSPIQDTFYGSVLSFRDPDDIQLELFVRAAAPQA
ncbi:MAG TPA: VOC family protein [Mycobacteriales bacterium]|jgi:catechol 2,3-dioxygenase-like lactoylglutathione lyase family enzyme|nr:VOC family protein [Mycobacteriales bacterium]